MVSWDFEWDLPSGNDCYIAIEALALSKLGEFSQSKHGDFPSADP